MSEPSELSSKKYKFTTPREKMFDYTQTCWCSSCDITGIYHHCKYLGGRMGAYQIDDDGNGMTLFRGDPEDENDAPPLSSK